MTQNAEQLESPATAQGPGDRLQAARISAGMTLEDLANQMHLSESILNSLEENNFDDITAPIFVKGYLRSYARIVRLDENEIINQYNHYYTDGDPPISSTSNTLPEINADDARVKWVTRLVVIALIGLLSLWWWNRYQQPAQPLSLDSSEQTQLAGGADNDIRIASVPKRDAELAQDVQRELSDLSAGADSTAMQPSVQNGVEDSAQAPDSATDMAMMNDPDAALPNAEEINAMVAQPDPGQNIEESADAGLSAAEMAEAAPAGAPASDEDLVIVVNADTWADIRDADGGKIVRDLLRTGRTLEVSGKAPLQVFLGNGYGVSLNYQGKEIDISGYIKPNNTARFKLEP